jgi:hypothetical protein
MHDDPNARHRALPPDRCGADMGLHWQHQSPPRRSEFFPLHQGPSFPSDHAPACSPLRRSNDFPVGDHTLQILSEEVCHMHPHRQWPDRTKPAVRSSFQSGHACPARGKTYEACKGYTIDQVVPMKRGGTDAPDIMQWQTTAAPMAKDKIE